MDALLTLLTTPSPIERADALTNAQIMLLGLSIAVIVLLVAIGILAGLRFRRRVGTGTSKKSEPTTSPWELAGQRAEPEPGGDPGSIDLGGDADPNDDTWAGIDR